jgi:DNA-binding response OmpR family regulator
MRDLLQSGEQTGRGVGPARGLFDDGGMVALQTMTSHVLIVEDDPTVAEVLSRFLRREGYQVEVASDGPAGLARALSGVHDLVILDLMLPGLGGLEVCRRLREVAAIPVIMLTALGEEADRIAGLDLGADDYLAKPFSARELTARMKAVLRRANGLVTPSPQPVTEVLRAGDVEVDTGTHEARLAGRLVALTAKEFDLLAYLVRHPRQAFRREELLEAVWGFSHGDLSTVTVHVRRLREKIETDPSDPRRVCTVWGVGYRFEP